MFLSVRKMELVIVCWDAGARQRTAEEALASNSTSAPGRPSRGYRRSQLIENAHLEVKRLSSRKRPG
jgi:hypothetical protein